MKDDMARFLADTDDKGNACVYEGAVFVCYATDIQKAQALARTFRSLRLRKQLAALKAAIEEAQRECPAPIPPEAGNPDPIPDAPEVPGEDVSPEEGTGSLPGNGMN